MRKLFTSESVTEGHPDKLCDQIADAVLDAVIRKKPDARVACEVFATTGVVFVMGEVSDGAFLIIENVRSLDRFVSAAKQTFAKIRIHTVFFIFFGVDDQACFLIDL